MNDEAIMHSDGDTTFEYCNAAERHVFDNKDHTVNVRFTVDSKKEYLVLEVVCTSCGWWDHVGHKKIEKEQ